MTFAASTHQQYVLTDKIYRFHVMNMRILCEHIIPSRFFFVSFSTLRGCIPFYARIHAPNINKSCGVIRIPRKLLPCLWRYPLRWTFTCLIPLLFKPKPFKMSHQITSNRLMLRYQLTNIEILQPKRIVGANKQTKNKSFSTVHFFPPFHFKINGRSWLNSIRFRNQ